jgi:probable addiction module antidote protein
MTPKTTRLDAADHLTDKESIAAYLAAGFEDGNPELIRAALGDIARGKGMTEIAEATGLSRTSLYKALSQDGNVEFATVGNVLHSLGLRVGVRSAAVP